MCSGVAGGRGAWVHVPPSYLEIFSKYNRTLDSTEFVTIYGYVQSNIWHVAPASGANPWTPLGEAPSFVLPLSKFLATPLDVCLL